MNHPVAPPIFPLGLSIVLIIVGCGLPKPIHQPGLVTNWDKQTPLPQINAPSIMITLYTQRTFIDDRPSPSGLLTWESQRLIQQALNEVIRQFPVLANARPNIENTPYQLLIEATHARRRSQAKAVLSACTLFLVPFNDELSIELKARLYRGSTLMKSYQATGSHRLRIHLLSALTTAWTVNVPKRTLEDTFRDLFLQIQQDAPQAFSQPLESPRA